MRWKHLLMVMLIATACGSGEEAAETSTGSSSVVEGEDAGRTALTDARSRWRTEGPQRYVMVTTEVCPECDVIPSRNTIIDGVPIAANGDSFPMTMEDLFDEFERTLGHEQYADHVVSFDPTSGALLMWRAAFFPVGGNPTERGDINRLEPTADLNVVDLPQARDEMNCPADGWQEVSVGAFTISLPAELEDTEVEGVDSEVGRWEGARLDVDWDYGWYSNPLGGSADERSFISNNSILGVELVGDDRVSVHYPQVEREGGEWNALTLIVHHDEPEDSSLALCVARSLEPRR